MWGFGVKDMAHFEESHDYVDRLDAGLAVEAKSKELKPIRSSRVGTYSRVDSLSQKTLKT